MLSPDPINDEPKPAIGGIPCVTFVTDANGTQITVNRTSATTSPICVGVSGDPAIVGMVGATAGTAKAHQLGGVGVVR